MAIPGNSIYVVHQSLLPQLSVSPEKLNVSGRLLVVAVTLLHKVRRVTGIGQQYFWVLSY